MSKPHEKQTQGGGMTREIIDSVRFALKLAGCKNAKAGDTKEALAILAKRVPRLIEDIDRLNRIMPHIGQTCKKWIDYLKCKNSCGTDGCTSVGRCPTGEWVLKE